MAEQREYADGLGKEKAIEVYDLSDRHLIKEINEGPLLEDASFTPYGIVARSYIGEPKPYTQDNYQPLAYRFMLADFDGRIKKAFDLSDHFDPSDFEKVSFPNLKPTSPH